MCGKVQCVQWMRTQSLRSVRGKHGRVLNERKNPVVFTATGGGGAPERSFCAWACPKPTGNHHIPAPHTQHTHTHTHTHTHIWMHCTRILFVFVFREWRYSWASFLPPKLKIHAPHVVSLLGLIAVCGPGFLLPSPAWLAPEGPDPSWSWASSSPPHPPDVQKGGLLRRERFPEWFSHFIQIGTVLRFLPETASWVRNTMMINSVVCVTHL